MTSVSKNLLRLLAILLAAGASGPSLSTGEVLREEIIRSWPEAPQKARVHLIKVVESPGDFWGGKSALSGILGRALGVSSAGEAWRPYGVCVDPLGRVLVTDNAGGRVFLIDRDQKKTKEIKDAGDVKLSEPVSVAAGPAGDFFVADPALGLLLHYGKSGDFIRSIGPAELARPTGLAVDRLNGRIVVTDTAEHKVWILELDGTPVLSFGSRGAGSGEFNYPTHASVAPGGDILITDALNHRVQIFTASGEMKGSFGEVGDGLGAFDRPKGLASDGRGHIFVVDAMMSTVQIFDTSGTLLLVIGGPGTDEGQFSLPSGIYIDETGVIYIADTFNGRLQVFRFADEED